MKKRLATILSLILAASLVSACGSSSGSDSDTTSDETAEETAEETEEEASEEEETEAEETEAEESADTESASTDVEFSAIKIGFATSNVDESFLAIQDALEDVVGPLLNIEFVYSEEISDSGTLNTFIENCYASGCVGVFTNYSTEEGAAVAADLGLYFVLEAAADAESYTDLEYFLSVDGASSTGYGTAYAEALNSVLSDGEEHSVLILSGAACYGATSFIEGTVGTLDALAELYGLTYTEDVYDLATCSAQTTAENDQGITITIFPGMSDLATSVSPLLQTGNYDVVVGTTDIYSTLGVAIDEVETALGMDIKVISRNTPSDTISEAMNSTDSQGSPVIDAIVTNGTFENIISPILIRNAVDGYAENMRDDGYCSRITGAAPLAITSAEDYNVLTGDDIPYAYMTEEDILSLCSLVNPDITWEDISEFGASLTTENLVEKFSE